MKQAAAYLRTCLGGTGGLPTSEEAMPAEKHWLTSSQWHPGTAARRYVRHVLTLSLTAAALAGCTQHTVKVEPIEVKPITAHLTVDMNVQVQERLDRFFDFDEPIDEAGDANQAQGDPAAQPRETSPPASSSANGGQTTEPADATAPTNASSSDAAPTTENPGEQP